MKIVEIEGNFLKTIEGVQNCYEEIREENGAFLLKLGVWSLVYGATNGMEEGMKFINICP